MTEHSPNDQFRASAFLDGANADYIDQLQARFAADPASVDAAWAELFRSLGDSELDAKRAASGPSWARADWPPSPADDLTAAMTGEWPAAPAKEGKAAAQKIAAKAEEKGVSLTDAQLQRAVLDSPDAPRPRILLGQLQLAQGQAHAALETLKALFEKADAAAPLAASSLAKAAQAANLTSTAFHVLEAHYAKQPCIDVLEAMASLEGSIVCQKFPKADGKP